MTRLASMIAWRVFVVLIRGYGRQAALDGEMTITRPSRTGVSTVKNCRDGHQQGEKQGEPPWSAGGRRTSHRAAQPRLETVPIHESSLPRSYAERLNIGKSNSAIRHPVCARSRKTTEALQVMGSQCHRRKNLGVQAYRTSSERAQTAVRAGVARPARMSDLRSYFTAPGRDPPSFRQSGRSPIPTTRVRPDRPMRGRQRPTPAAFSDQPHRASGSLPGRQ